MHVILTILILNFARISWMRTIAFISLIFLATTCARAQNLVPVWYVANDVVYDVESIPNISYEHFFIKNEKLKSWRLKLGYQVHYNDSFGFVNSHHGDKVSIGVYQGPLAAFGYSLYSPRHRRKWNNYSSLGFCAKYLWYDSIPVIVNRSATELAYRMQSEKCIELLPQASIGAKRIKGEFCADFYMGIQGVFRCRYKTIYYDQANNYQVNPNVPYKTTQLTFAPNLLAGIKLGYIKMKRLPKEAHPE